MPLEPNARAVLESVPIGVPGTLRPMVADLAKAQDIRRSRRATLLYRRAGGPCPSVTIEGPATIQSTDPAPMTV